MSDLSIHVILRGGLGNQLFQYACAKAVSTILSIDKIFFVDTAYQPRDPIGRENYLKKLLGSQYLSSDLNIEKPIKVQEQNFFEILNLISLDRSLYSCVMLDGYFQSADYFLGIGPIIKSHIFSLLINLCEPRRDENITLHVRRSDYANFGLCSIEYYLSVVGSILDCSHEVQRIRIFSDEPLVANAYADVIINYLSIGRDQIFHDYETDPIVVLYKMSESSHLVIANSSLSWWAAYIADDTKTTIFCPTAPWILGSSANPAEPHWFCVNGAVRDNFSLDVSEELVLDYRRQITLQNFNAEYNKLCINCGSLPRVRIRFPESESYVKLCEVCIVTAYSALEYAESYSPHGVSLAALVPTITKRLRRNSSLPR